MNSNSQNLNVYHHHSNSSKLNNRGSIGGLSTDVMNGYNTQRERGSYQP